MPTIADATRETWLYMHTLAAALSAAARVPATMLDLSDIDEPSPAAQKAAVAARLSSVMGQLEKVIRSQKAPPAGISPATAGRLLVERDENYDASKRTYTPGPGFETLINVLFAQARQDAEDAGRRHTH